jgi:hypothetical protein
MKYLIIIHFKTFFALSSSDKVNNAFRPKEV